MKNYTLEIGKSLGSISLQITEPELEKILGRPSRVENEEQDGSQSVRMDYDMQGLSFLFVYENGQKTLDIQTDRLDYNGQNWYDLNKREVLEQIEHIYTERNLAFEYECYQTDLNDEQFEEYMFDAIGIMLWFTDDMLTNVSVSMPDNN